MKHTFFKKPKTKLIKTAAIAIRRVLSSILILLILLFWTTSKLPRIPLVNFPPEQKIAYASNTGFVLPSTLPSNTCTAPTTGNFTDDAPPDNNNDLYACAVDNNPNVEENFQFSGYSFGLTASAKILGIVVHLNDVHISSATAGGTQDFKVRISWDGGTTWTAAAQNDSDTCTTGDIGTAALDGDEYYCNNSTSTAGTSEPSSGTFWGRSNWTTTELNSSNFVVHIVGDNNNNTARINYVDVVDVKVYYTSTFTLSAYRWYVDSDNENVTDIWGNPDIAESTALTTLPASQDPPKPTQELRLRVALTVGTVNLATSDVTFKLEYKAGTDGSCTTGSWTDVGAGGGAEIWRYATSSVTDGADITVTKLTPSDVLEEYAKSNPTQTNHNSGTTTQDVEYDFHLEHNSAAAVTQYSFRLVYNDTQDNVLGTYTVCPTLTTRPETDNLMRHGNFFENNAERGFFWAN